MHDPEPRSIPGLPRELPAHSVRPHPGASGAATEHASCLPTAPGFVFAPEFVGGGSATLRSRQPPSALPRASAARPWCESLGTLP